MTDRTRAAIQAELKTVFIDGYLGGLAAAIGLVETLADSPATYKYPNRVVVRTIANNLRNLSDAIKAGLPKSSEAGEHRCCPHPAEAHYRDGVYCDQCRQCTGWQEPADA